MYAEIKILLVIDMVIQRWQSLLLLLAAVMMACFTFCSLGQVQTTDFSLNFTSLGFTYEGEATDGAPTGYFLHTWYFFILSLTTAILTLIDIFLFNNLRLQKRILLICILFTIAAACVAAGLGYTAVEGYSVSWSSLALSPLLAIIALIMAYSCINRDERRLRSVDRIR